MAVQQIPNGEQVFLDNNGVPVQFGKVWMYIPNTTTSKTTWQDPDQIATNTNPIDLDGAGRAVIWGAGYYRQILEDSLGNQIWDKVVAASTGQDVYWGGTSGGTPNNQTLTVPGFSNVSGVILDFVAGFTNTSALFVTVNGGTPLQVFANTASGAQPLVGGEIVAGNTVSVIADTVLGGLRLVSGSANTRNLNVVGSFARSGVLSVSLVGDVNDYNPPGISSCSVLRISSTILVNISGLAQQAPSSNGFDYIIDNVGSANVVLLANSILSNAQNRFLINGPVTLAPNESCELHYDTVAAGWRVIPPPSTAAVRAKLTANTTYFVRTDGNDSNNGLTNSAAGAFLTWQGACNALAKIDFNGFTVVVSCTQTGVTFGAGMLVPPMVGQTLPSQLIFRGDTGTPGNVLISVTNADGFAVDRLGMCRIEGFKFQASGTTSGRCIVAIGGEIEVQLCEFGTVAQTPGSHIAAYYGGTVNAVGNYTITGGANKHYDAEYGYIGIPSGITVTLTGTLSFSGTAFARSSRMGFIDVNVGSGGNPSYTGGTISGSRYFVFGNSIISANSNTTLFPGNSAGTTASGGQYL